MDKKYRNHFIKAIEALLEIDTTKIDMKEMIEHQKKVVDKFNDDLELNGEVEFLTEYQGVDMPPVVFNTTSGKVKLVYLGLNPLADKHSTVEKQKAGDNLDEYMNFYIGKRAFEHVLCVDGAEENVKVSPYYQTLGSILNALRTGEYKNWKQHFTRNVEEEQGLKRYYNGLLDSIPTMVLETIPFHSKKTAAFDVKRLQKLIERNGNYKRYLEELNAIIDTALEEEGLIIANGKAAMSTCRLLHSDKAEDVGVFSLEKALGKAKCEFYSYEGKKVILFHQQLRSQRGFNSGNEINLALSAAFDHFNKNK